jgi:hypothetical protein
MMTAATQAGITSIVDDFIQELQLLQWKASANTRRNLKEAVKGFLSSNKE